MTREEAITTIERLARTEAKWPGTEDTLEALDFAITALRPVRREQVEKIYEGCNWCNKEGKKSENWDCTLLDEHGYPVMIGDNVIWTNAEFCPVCGKPLTDEAMKMVMDRLEELKDATD